MQKLRKRIIFIWSSATLLNRSEKYLCISKKPWKPDSLPNVNQGAIGLCEISDGPALIFFDGTSDVVTTSEAEFTSITDGTYQFTHNNMDSELVIIANIIGFCIQ